MGEDFYLGLEMFFFAEAEQKVTLEICKYPDRQRYALAIGYGNVYHPVAYFRTESAARECGEILKRLANARLVQR